MAMGALAHAAAGPEVEPRIDWAAYLATHDPAWEKLPSRWFEAPFLGNGELGTMMTRRDARTLRFSVGSSAVHDHRPVDEDLFSERGVEVLNRGRLFIGDLELDLPADVVRGSAELSLHEAEARGTIEGEEGTLTWNARVHATEPVMCFEFEGERVMAGARWIYRPAAATSSRARGGLSRKPANPPAELSERDGVSLAVHRLHAGGQTAVAWRETGGDGHKTLWLSVAHSYPGDEASDRAVAAVLGAANADPQEWISSHREWWANYYPHSFISTGDPYWDAFYWIQQYKRACATRDKGWIIDNQGPWLQPTPWNATWWNLNIQLSHSGANVANRRGMATALSHRLDVHRDALARNVAEKYRGDSYAIGRGSSGWDLLAHAGEPGGRDGLPEDMGAEVGNLLWALHNVGMEVRHHADDELRDRVLWPLLVRAVNYYRHFLTEGDDGRLHLPPTHSPEYGNAPDCSYDLSLLRWASGRLLEVADERGLSDDDEPLIAEWRRIREKLAPLSTNEHGIMVGRGVGFDKSHRHWSHLIGIYPLRTITPDTDGQRELIERSLERWHSFPGAMQGYSFTGGASIAALLGDGDLALEKLNGLRRFLKPSTMYAESGPVMETPLHAATSIQEMLFQSWGGVLRVFPATPAKWPDARFHQLRGEGAHLVSACREKGGTTWVHIRSEKGGEVVIDPSIESPAWVADESVKLTPLEAGRVKVSFPPDTSVLLWPAGEPRPEPIIEPAPADGPSYRFGLN